MNVLISILLLLAVAVPGFAEELLDNDVHAVILINKARSKHQYQTNSIPGPGDHNRKLRSYRNSDIAAHQQKGGRGVSIGNVYPAPGTNRSHSTTVVVQGHIINSSK